MNSQPTGISPMNRRLRASADTITRQDKYVSAVTNKLILPSGVNRASGKVGIPTQQELIPIIRSTMQQVTDAENVFEMLPDLEFVASVVVSSILSTKDLITTTLDFDITDTFMTIERRNRCLKVIREYFTTDFKLSEMMYDIVYDMLFKRGSYALAVIPESSVDQIINSSRGAKVSLESLREIDDAIKTSVGVFGNKPSSDKGLGFTLESLYSQVDDVKSNEPVLINDGFEDIKLIDNTNSLKMPKIRQTIISQHINKAYNVNVDFDSFDTDVIAPVANNVDAVKVATETVYGGKITASMDRNVYKDPLYTAKAIVEVPRAENTTRASVGQPLTMHIPSESVIPIHVPGDMKIHVGYIVLLDNLGNPINKEDLINSNIAWSWITGSATSNIISDAARGLGMGNQSDMEKRQEQWTVSQLTNSYADIVESKLLNAINNGIYGNSVSMTRPQEVYRIMMARSLAKMNTQMLFIPSEQMTYFAIDYNKYGIGRSLVDKSAVLTMLRSVLHFATMQGSVLNASRNMEVDVTLDPNDREGDKTIEDVQYRVQQSYNARIPYTGTTDDMMAYMANAGISYNVEGNEYTPSTKVNVSERAPDYKIPDQDTNDLVNKQLYRALWADPDLIINPGEIEFASQVVSKNLLNTQRIVKAQERINPLVTNVSKQIMISDGTLLKRLADTIREDFTEEEMRIKGLCGKHINEVLGGLEVTLPPPDVSLLGSQYEQYEKYRDSLESAIQAWVDENSSMSEVSEMAEKIKRYLLRQWQRRYGMLPEIDELFNGDTPRPEIIAAIADDEVTVNETLIMMSKRISSRLETIAKSQGVDGGGDDYSGGYGSGDDGGYGNDGSDSGDGDFGDSGFDDGFDDGDSMSDDNDMGGEDDLSESDEETDESAESEDSMESDDDVDADMGADDDFDLGSDTEEAPAEDKK